MPPGTYAGPAVTEWAAYASVVLYVASFTGIAVTIWQRSGVDTSTARLGETQRADGGWDSAEGPVFDVNTTLVAIRACI